MKTLPSLAAAGAVLLAILATPLSAAATAPAEISISGEVRVIDPTGVVLPFERVTVRAFSLHGDVVAESSGTGGFALNGLAEGSYVLRAEAAEVAPGWYGGASSRSAATVVSTSTESADIVLRPGGSVSGTARFSGALPAQRPDIAVTPYLLDPVTGGWERMSTSATVDFSVQDDPSFRLEHLAPGRYALRAHQWTAEPAYGDQWWSDASSSDGAALVDVAAGAESTGVSFVLPPWQWSLPRVDGRDRYDTAVRLTASEFEPGLPVVYVASGATWPDALSAGPAASALGGALLLTDPVSLPSSVAAELVRLRPERVVVVGSALTISAPVLDAVARASGAPTQRIGGKDRYETSRLLVDDVFDRDRTAQVFLATGTNYPDALSVGPIAGRRHEAVLLVDGAQPAADTPTRQLLEDLSPGTLVALGGEPSIRQTVLDSLAQGPWTIERIAGRDRSETSFLLVGEYPTTSEMRYVVNEGGFADALAVSTVAAAKGANVALTPSDCMRAAIPGNARHSAIDTLVLVGGLGTLSPGVAALAPCRS